MDVDQNGGAKVAVQARKQPPQRAMIGLIEAVDALQRLADRNTLIVDFLRIANDARHRAEAARHPHRAGIGE